jgi:two-component system sensor histidine kinase AlgZ
LAAVSGIAEVRCLIDHRRRAHHRHLQHAARTPGRNHAAASHQGAGTRARFKLATEAQLASLESRIHPHFLFNTLNSISSLIPEDPARAERLVEQMAALLRFSLDANQSGLVPLASELKIVADYLDIERARFGDRLRYQIDVPADLNESRIPPLSLQTLVENSVKFAIAPDRAGGEIRITGARADGAFRVEVSDSGPAFQLESAPAGHGLDNLKGRLSALFGDRAALLLQRVGGRNNLILSVPLICERTCGHSWLTTKRSR